MTRISFIVASGTAMASVQLTVNFDMWQIEAGNSTALDFVFDTPQVITDEYAALGVLFPDGDENDQTCLSHIEPHLRNHPPR